MHLERNLILLASVCYQANMRIICDGQYTPPKDFKEVATFGSTNYTLAGFIIESPCEIVVAFRGTEVPLDIITDLEWDQKPYPFVPNSGLTDLGFTNDYKSVRSEVISTLKKLPSSKKLAITGHSLGAAVATLAALDIATNTDFSHPQVYTYASPRVGNPEFANIFNKRIDHSIRVVNNNDVVPYFPLQTIPLLNLSYRHVSERYPINFQTYNILTNHEVEYYFRRLSNMYEKLGKEICYNNPGLCPP